MIRRFFKDFKSFAMQGNVLNLAVGVMIGGAFGKIVASLVNDIFMPLIGFLTGGVNSSFSSISSLFVAMDGQYYQTAQEAAQNNVGTLNYGAFLSNIVDFFLMAICIYLFVRLVNKLMPKVKETPKPPARKCPYCVTEVNEKATRCPHCTSRLELDLEEKSASIA